LISSGNPGEDLGRRERDCEVELTMLRGARGRWAAILVVLFLMQVAAHLVYRASLAKSADDVHALKVEDYRSGKTVSIGEFVGDRPALLVFWTTWCAYCREELKSGAGLVKELSATPAPVAVVFVNVREHRLAVGADPGLESIADRIVLDGSGQLADALGATGFPAYALLDRRGRRVWTHVGLEPDIQRKVAASLASGGGVN
jgi:thiol-disulfide isomerase/thioredoxin